MKKRRQRIRKIFVFLILVANLTRGFYLQDFAADEAMYASHQTGKILLDKNKNKKEELEKVIDVSQKLMSAEELINKDDFKGARSTLKITQRMMMNLSKREHLERKYEELSGRVSQWEQHEQMKFSLKAKLDFLQISDGMDMSIPIGFTEEEMRYLLNHFEKIQDKELVEILAREIVQQEREYPVNEIFLLAVMSLESGFFTSDLALYSHNYGGMMSSNGAMHFASKEEGVQRAHKCLWKNLKGNNTAYEVSRTYCFENPKWTSMVLAIMEEYQGIEIM